MLPPFPKSILASTLLLLLPALRTDAATLTWDAITGNGTLQDGTGTWDTTASNLWTTDGGVTNTAWNSTTPDNAIIGGGASGTAGTITLGETITVGNLTFKAPFAGSYTIAPTISEQLNFGIANPMITLATGTTATINAASASSTRDVDVTLGNNASLVLGGATMAFRSLDLVDAGTSGTGMITIASGAAVTTTGNSNSGNQEFNVHFGDNSGALMRLDINGSLTTGAGGIGTRSGATTTTINVNNGGSLTAGLATLGWNSSATLNIAATAAVTISGNLAHTDGGTGTVNLNGGTLTAGRIFNGAGTQSFTVNLDGGKLVAASANLFLPDSGHNELAILNIKAGGITIDTAGFNVSAMQGFSGGTTGALQKTGVGTLSFAGSNATGAITVSGGTANLHFGLSERTSSGAKALTNLIAPATVVVLDGGGLTITGRADAVAAGPRNFTYNSSGSNTNYKLLRAGSTTGLVVGMTITGTNIPAGAYITEIIDGTTLRMSADATGGVSNGTTSVSFGAVTGNTTTQTINNVSLLQSGTITVDKNEGSGTTLNVGTLTTASGAGLTKAGDGTLIITSATGLTLDGALSVTGGTLDISALSAANLTFGSLATSSGTTFLFGTKNLTVGSDNTSTTVASVLGGGATSLTKVGTGTMTLSGANTYTGVTTISAGTLSVSSIGDGGVASSNLGSATNAAANLVLAGGTLLYTGGTASTDRNFTINNGAIGLINVSTSATTLTMTGTAPTTTGQLNKTGAGTLVLDPGAGSFSVGSLTANGGSLILKSGTFTTTAADPFNTAYQVGAGARGGNLTIDGATLIVGGFSLKVGAAANGNLNIISGTVTASNLVLGHNGSAVGTQSGGDVTVTNLFHQDGGNGSYTLTGGTLTAKRISDATSVSNSFTFNLNGGTLKSAASTTNLIDNGGGPSEVTVLLGTGNTIIDTTNSSATIVRSMGDMSGQAGAFTKAGANTLTLTGANTYTGTTTVTGGALQVGISGTGTTGTGAVTVKTGGTLLGSGVVQGSSFTAEGGSTVHAGDGTAQSNYGTLAFTPVSGSGTFDFQAGSTIVLGINPGGTSDLLSFDGLSAGTLNFNGNLTVGPASFTPSAPEVFKLLNWANLTTVTFDSRYTYTGLLTGTEVSGFDLPDISGSGYFWDISQFTTNGTIAIVVPEPSRALLLGFAFACAAFRRRR